MTLFTGTLFACRAARNIDFLSARPRRVTLLVLGIIALSLVDLLITLAYLQANWMIEANPIAAYLIRTTQSVWALVAFKACSVGVCATLLLLLRRFRAGEVAAWCGLSVLAALAVMWHAYSMTFEGAESILLFPASIAYDDGRLGLP